MLVFYFCSYQVTWFASINLFFVDKIAFNQDHDNSVGYWILVLAPDCDFCSIFTNDGDSWLMFNLPDLKCSLSFLYTIELWPILFVVEPSVI
jgi:hypothetical protein